MLEGPGKLEVKAVFFLLSPESAVQAQSCWVEGGEARGQSGIHIYAQGVRKVTSWLGGQQLPCAS